MAPLPKNDIPRIGEPPRSDLAERGFAPSTTGGLSGLRRGPTEEIP